MQQHGETYWYYLCSQTYLHSIIYEQTSYLYSIFLNNGPFKFWLEGGCVNGGTLLKFSTQ